MLSLHPGFGGATSANANIIKMLSNKNEVFYIDEYIEFTQMYLEENAENVKLIHYLLRKNKFFPWKIKKTIQDLEPDFIIVAFPFLLIFYWPILLYFRLSGCKIITIFHSLNLGENFTSKILDFFVATCALVSNKLVFVSNFTFKSWNKFLSVKLLKQQSTIFNAVHLPAIFNANNSIRTIGFIGRLSAEKQPELFCKVAERAALEGLPYQFIIFGDGPLSKELMNKYSHYVLFKGVVFDQDELYDTIDLLLMTSKFENCPMVVLESKSRGIPSICPRVGGIPEIINHGNDGSLLDEPSLTSIIAEIAIINEDYRFYSSNCIKNSNRFSVDSITFKWESLVQ
jgi:glycosyltransferase involved in cell wall biosynthesis